MLQKNKEIYGQIHMLDFDNVKMFYKDGEELKPIGHIEDIDLTFVDDSEPYTLNDVFGKNEIFAGEIEMTTESGRNVFRLLESGGDRGRYNGLTLRDEGYLSPQNGWL